MSGLASFVSRVDDHGHSLYDHVVFYAAVGLMTLAIVLGGGTVVGRAADENLLIVSVPIFALALYGLFSAKWRLSWYGPLAILAMSMALPLLQLVPLAPSLWTALPGRDSVVEVYQAVGIPIGPRPLSLAPHATVYAFLSLLPAAALFLIVLPLDTERRFAFLSVPLGLGAVSALLGLAQIFTAYNPYTLDGQGVVALGFFANRNHFAALLYVLLPLSIVWTTYQARRSEGGRWKAIYGGAVVICLLAGLSVAFSRAGVALGVVAVLGSAFIVWRSSGTTRFGRWPIVILGGGLVIFAVILQLGLIDLLIQRSVVDTVRQTIRALTVEAIQHYSFAGSGFGTFVPVFKSFEQPASIGRFYVNHAHNDWLELTLEGGILAVLLLAAFVVWFLTRLWSIWLSRSDLISTEQNMLASAASLSIILLLLHSLLDYPLRTETLMAWFAVACAFVCTAPEIVRSRSSRRRSSQHRSSQTADAARHLEPNPN